MEESLSDPAALPAPGATLLLPAVTVGNVGQLAIDLLVQSTVGSRRIGSLQSATVVPVTGGCAFSSADGALHGPARELELYVVDGKLVLQQRAPALPGCQRRFARELADWIESKGIEKVIVIGSIESGSLVAAGLEPAPPLSMRTWPPECATPDAPELPDAWFEGRPAESRVAPPWPLMTELLDRDLDAVALLAPAADGNNLPEAHAAASALADAAGIPLPTGGAWRAPPSWRGLFGVRRDGIMY